MLTVNGSNVQEVLVNNVSARYIQKDGALVWAAPNLYVKGPVNYRVVGSPDITNYVLSNIANGHYLELPTHLSVGENQSFEAVFKIKMLAERNDQECVFTPGYDGVGYDCGVWIWPSGVVRVDLYGFIRLRSTKTLSLNTDYWLKISRNSTHCLLEVSTDGVNYETWASSEATTAAYNPTTYLPRIGNSRVAVNQPFSDGTIDLSATYIKVNGSLWFYGNNYTSDHKVPVPARYTLGNMTTPGIGYVDLRTQQFTAAPEGATLGRDE